MKLIILIPLAWAFAGISSALAAPVNDNFNVATPISAAGGSTPAVSTTTATGEAGEPQHAGITGGHSIWHRLTHVTKDRFIFNTNGSSYDTTLAAYTGSVVNVLTELASDDDGGDGTQSLIEFTAGPGNPVSIAIDGYDGASGNAMLAWTTAPLTNNAFASAISLSGAQGARSGWNYRASAEANEPNAGTSVWYSWTAPANSTGLFTVNSPDMESFIGVYTGISVGALTQVSTGTAATGIDAQVSFNAVSGTVYRIQIKGNTGGTGEFTLTWGISGGGSGPMLPDIISVASQENDFMYGWNLDQTQIPGRTLLRVTTATANVGSGKLELRGSAANPAVYQRVFNVNGTYTDRFASTFTFHPTHGHLHFDDWLQFHIRAVTPGGGVGDIIAAGDKTSFAIIDLGAHDLGLPGAPSSAVYSGGLVQGISVGWRDIYSSSLTVQWIDVTNVPPGTYWLESVVDPDNRVLEADDAYNSTRIQITYVGAAPPNNAFSASTLLTGATASTNGRSFSATKETSEPSHAGNIGGKSIWYRWVATATGAVTVSTAGSNFDTLLGVYTGTAVNGLTVVASNDNDGALTTSRVTFNAVNGTTYRIAVDGKDGAAGTVEIAINPASNDHFAFAQAITGNTGITSGSNHGATAEASEPAHAGGAAESSIWYFWTAPLTGDAAFTTEGSAFNARLGIYSGGSLNALTPVASSVGTAFNAPATVHFHIDSGTRYYLAVDGGPGAVRLAWQAATAIAPYVITHPPTGNHQQGANMQLTAAIGGSPTMTYQWRFAGNVISDGAEHSGTNTQTLSVWKTDFADSGIYTLTGSNPSGTVTTNAANIIIITNPRAASLTDSAGDIGGSVFIPVMFNTTGNEHGLQFTLTYDPAVLGNGRLSPVEDTAGSTIVLDRSQEAAGRLGVVLTLPGIELFHDGLHQAMEIQFDVSPTAAPGMATLGFASSPVVHQATTLAGEPLAVVLDAANITLSNVQAGISSTPAAGGGRSFTVRGLRGKTYELLQSTSLSPGSWMAVQSQTIGANGIVVFTLPPAADLRGFFKAAPVP